MCAKKIDINTKIQIVLNPKMRTAKNQNVNFFHECITFDKIIFNYSTAQDLGSELPYVFRFCI